MMVGRDLSGHYFAERGSGRGKKVLSVQHLCTDNGLSDVCFDVYEGEILGIAGLVGSGRTELMRAIFGADPRTRGEIEVAGVVTRINSPKDAVGCGIGFVPEDRKIDGLCLPLEIWFNTTLASLDKVSTAGVMHLGAEKKVVAEQIKALRVVTPSADQLVGNLSGGNQQKVVLAKWLAAGCKVIILDEPTRGIDVGAKTEVYGLLNKLAEEGKAILFISSELPELFGIADRILVMRRGQLVGNLATQQTTPEQVMHLAAVEEKT
jgi:ribose transport system ATP-binding protein